MTSSKQKNLYSVVELKKNLKGENMSCLEETIKVLKEFEGF